MYYTYILMNSCIKREENEMVSFANVWEITKPVDKYSAFASCPLANLSNLDEQTHLVKKRLQDWEPALYTFCKDFCLPRKIIIPE